MWIVQVAKEVPELQQASPQALINLVNRWMFRTLSCSRLSVELTKLAGCRVKSLHLTFKLKEHPSFFDYKIWLAYTVKTRLDEAEAMRLLRKWKLPLSFVYGLRDSSIRQVKMQIRDYECEDLYTARNRLDSYIAELAPWLGKFVYRKLRFIETVQRVGKTVQDLQHDLIIEGLRGYYSMYPLYSTHLHAMNTLKRIMHNCGINLIKHYTRQRVSGTIHANGSNQARLVDMHICQLQIEPAENQDKVLDVRSVMHKYKGRKRIVLEALCGKYNEQFSAWLLTQGKRPNDELFDRVKLDTYVRLLARWLHVKYAAIVKFIDRVKASLLPWAIA